MTKRVALALAIAVCTTVTGRSQQPVPQASVSQRTIAPGSVVHAEISEGFHEYHVVADAGTFLRFVVQGQSETLDLTLIGPDQRTLHIVTAGDGRIRRSLSWVTATAGNYVLQVRLLVLGGARRSVYDLAFERPVPADDHHRARVTAERIVQAVAAMPDGASEAEIRRATEELHRAYAIFKDSGDPDGEAVALNNAASGHFQLGELDEAISALRIERELHRLAGETAAEGNTIEQMGVFSRLLGDFQQMLDFSHEALALSRSARDFEGIVNGLMGLGNAYGALNDYARSAAAFEEADAISNAPTRNGARLRLAGDARQSAGQSREAVAHYEAAAKLARNNGWLGVESSYLNRAAGAYADLGDQAKAIEYMDRVLAYWKAQQKTPDPATLTQLGRNHAKLGQRDQAIELLDQALAATPDAGHAAGRDLGGLGGAYREVRDPAKSLACDEETLVFIRAEHNPIRESRVLARMAASERDLGRLASARTHIEQALALFEMLRASITSPGIRTDYFATIQEHYGLYIDILMRLHAADPLGGFGAAAMRASERRRARGLLDLLTEAGVDFRRGVDIAQIQKVRQLEQQIGVLASRLQVVSGRKNSQQQASVLAGELSRRSAELDLAQGQIRKASPEYAVLAQPDPLAVDAIQEQLLDQDTLILEYSLGEPHSYLWVVSRDGLSCFDLPSRTQLEAAAKRVYGLLTERNRRPAGETAVQRLVRLSKSQQEFTREARRLSDAVLGPAAALLGRRRLAIVAEGALQYIPFAALPNPAPRQGTAETRWLAEDHEIISLPSGSVLAAIRSSPARRYRADKAVAILADPVFDGSDPRIRRSAGAAPTRPGDGSRERARTTGAHAAATDLERSLAETGVAASGPLQRLSFSRREALAIAGVLPPGQAFEALDFRASKSTATDPLLGTYRVVHFATHGLLDSANPALSGLVLSLVDERGASVDGFLRLQDVYNLSLPVELVVLSACQTALGQDVRGEGLIGLTRGFLYAGAASVAASLWRVDDLATAELMSRFYAAMLRDGQRPAAALRAAQTAMSRESRWRDPYYWAGFQIQGDWK